MTAILLFQMMHVEAFYEGEGNQDQFTFAASLDRNEDVQAEILVVDLPEQNIQSIPPQQKQGFFRTILTNIMSFLRNLFG